MVTKEDAHSGKSVRLVCEDGEQIILEVPEALRRAKDAGLDLVVVAENADIPVCKLMNFGKFQYQRKRQLRDQKKKQHVHRNKEIKFHANIDPHDYDFKVGHIRAFLEKGHRVKVSLFFRGREMARRDRGMELMQNVVDDLNTLATVENEPRMVGKNVSMLLAPNKT